MQSLGLRQHENLRSGVSAVENRKTATAIRTGAGVTGVRVDMYRAGPSPCRMCLGVNAGNAWSSLREGV